ncbi:MAG: hypothetical protein IT423_19665 [Pirellulaceae bacterium]|nr:hypothetical protein [Pirellulaceae bacterium]
MWNDRPVYQVPSQLDSRPASHPISRLFQVCVVGCLWLLIAGCREHPQVTSRHSLDLIKQVYTACNTRNPERLTRCRQKYDQLVAQGELSDAEQASFQRILQSADSGDWPAAQSASLQFARDQVR